MFIPLLLITLPGGTLADRVDRRRLVLAVAVGQMALSAVLFALAAFGGASLWSLYALVALGARCSARSARRPQQTFIPRLVPRAQLGPAMALNRIVFQVVMIAGPSLAGVVTAWTGLRGCYLAGRHVVRGGAVGRGPAARDAAGKARGQPGRSSDRGPASPVQPGTVRPGTSRPRTRAGPGRRSR